MKALLIKFKALEVCLCVQKSWVAVVKLLKFKELLF